jgi:hypothetical protein
MKLETWDELGAAMRQYATLGRNVELCAEAICKHAIEAARGEEVQLMSISNTGVSFMCASNWVVTISTDEMVELLKVGAL